MDGKELGSRGLTLFWSGFLNDVAGRRDSWRKVSLIEERGFRFEVVGASSFTK
jgi:hypothetical protein